MDMLFRMILEQQMNRRELAGMGQMMNPYERDLIITSLPTRKLNIQDFILSKSCRICLNQFEVGEDVKTLPCLHQFHVNCCDPWFQTKLNCPVCRHSIQQNDHQTM